MSLKEWGKKENVSKCVGRNKGRTAKIEGCRKRKLKKEVTGLIDDEENDNDEAGGGGDNADGGGIKVSRDSSATTPIFQHHPLKLFFRKQ